MRTIKMNFSTPLFVYLQKKCDGFKLKLLKSSFRKSIKYVKSAKICDANNKGKHLARAKNS
jgi:hypothetical protein